MCGVEEWVTDQKYPTGGVEDAHALLRVYDIKMTQRAVRQSNNVGCFVRLGHLRAPDERIARWCRGAAGTEDDAVSDGVQFRFRRASGGNHDDSAIRQT